MRTNERLIELFKCKHASVSHSYVAIYMWFMWISEDFIMNCINAFYFMLFTLTKLGIHREEYRETYTKIEHLKTKIQSKASDS